MNKKILFVIDHFGSGGAQRQITNLAIAFKKKGYDCEMFVYHPKYDFFKREIVLNNINVHTLSTSNTNPINIICTLRKIIKRNKYSVIISYLDTPNIYSEIACMGMRGIKLIVSERNSYLLEKSKIYSLLRRILHVASDNVVTNSRSQADWLIRTYPWLEKKVLVIYNGYDTSNYSRNSCQLVTAKGLKIIGIGRIARQKNQLMLINALDLFYRLNGWCPEINWVGSLNDSAEPKYKKQVLERLEKCAAVQDRWKWLGERSDVPRMISENHVLIQPSIFEGLPNAICESMLCGRPVLASAVCDAPLLVEDGIRGFLFNPNSEISICDAINRFISLEQHQIDQMALNAIDYANANISIENMVDSYEKII